MSSAMKLSLAVTWAVLAEALVCSAGEQAPSDERARVQGLIRQLRSGGPGAKQEDAAYDLGKLGPKAKEAIPALIEALDPKNDDDLRKYVVHALGEIAPDDKTVIARLALLSRELVRRPDLYSDRTVGFLFEATARALGKGGAAAVPTLVEMLAICRSGDEIEIATSRAATAALADIGLPALPALLDALKDPSRRLGAIQAIGDIGSQGASASVPALLRYIDDADDRVRGSVYEALGKIGPAASDAVPALIAALDQAGDLRLDAAYALGRIGAKAAAALPRLERLWVETGHNDQVKWAIDQIRGKSEDQPRSR